MDFLAITVHETEGLFALAGENSQESLWKEELTSLNRFYTTFLQLHVDLLVTVSDRWCHVQWREYKPCRAALPEI